MTMRPRSTTRGGSLLVTALVTFGLSCAAGYAQTTAPKGTVPKSPALAAKPAPSTPVPGTSGPPRRPALAPDPGLFDGSGYPPEERPERGLLADFEAGQHEPSAGDPDGEPKLGGGGQQEQALAGITPMTPSLTQQTQQGGQQNGGSGGGEGEQGQQGQPGEQGQSATPIAASADQKPVKPGEVALGDPNARIAQSADARQAQGNAQNERGEDRMSVKAAAGQQSSPNRSRGSERGVDIPSNL
jgi:hypothetical protein